ncbi:hypothetical protein C0995_004223 [Termitomyces sp. Mi166|nr:hypothetical protein C0995_004223 [Termitomyces sp. Mi166\
MPSQESIGSSSGQFDSEPRRSRIHFPIEETSPSRHIHRSVDAAALRPLSRGVKTSPARRNLTSTLNPHTPASRKRVRPVGTTADVFQGSPLSHRQLTNAVFTPLRAAGSHLERGVGTMDIDSAEHNIFSDEYDLYPKILQDVQRALKLKARREARLSDQATPPKSDSSSFKPQRAISLTTQPMSPISPNKDLSSDIDFSPSTGTALHPVPASLDNGLTLDWSGVDDKPESKWKLTGTKRKGKEALPPSAVVREQQQTTYADKLGRLRSIASPQTIKKAKITQDQLGRRYNLVFGILSSGKPPNLAEVARWCGQQDASTRNALQKAEPFTWLKHLEKRDNKSIDHSPWHISALIAEEYLRTRSRHDSMTTIPEDPPLHEGFHESPTSSLLIDSQLAPVTSHTSSNHILGPSLVERSSFEDGLTFEPRVNSTRTSLEVDTRKSHDSSFSSLPVGISSFVPASPTSGRGRPQHGPSQPIPTFLDLTKDQSSEHLRSKGSDPGGLRHQKSPTTRLDTNVKITSASDESEEEAPHGAGITLQLTAASSSDADVPKLQTLHPSARLRPAVFRRRRARVSLPSTGRISKLSAVQQQEADEQKAYEAKVRLLEQTTATNHRIRQLLSRISGDIREYDAVQSNAMTSLGIAHLGLPRELIDVFGHDPAAVTGATRRFQGWRAVDDIQHRLVRQREVFRAFLSRAQNQLPRTKSVLDDPISSLVQSLKALELHSQKIAGRAFEVGEALKTVQATHNTVKADYNKTLARTSVVYPELSHIVVLEESYKNQYQQFWEIGMDTLTFILDTVTPFWRTYGKTIGEDIRDFLIIPLYRNEFTGESKRYPVTRIPIRSPRHWFGLAIFFFTSVAVAIFQVKTALSSSALYKLPMIPYESIRWTALPFFWLSILIQWWAVVIEFIMVFLQLGVVVWWAGWFVRIFT